MDLGDYSKLSVNQLSDLLTKEKQPSGFLQNFSAKEHLELIGRLLSASQILSFLTQIPENQLQEKLPPLLVGISPDKFEELLKKASDKEMDVLKKEGFSETLSHHLTLLIHRIEEDNDLIFKTLSSLEVAIHALDPEITPKETIDSIQQQLRNCLKKLHYSIEKVKKGMVLVWNSSNIELIDTFNKVNIGLQKMHCPAELQALLNQKLFTIYQGLKDEDAAIDGLANFSVWYEEDYADVGLLPPSPSKNKEVLMQQVKDRLQQINLGTIKDLKSALIFSRQSLKEYISAWK